MKVVIRVDASVSMGTGHIMRCRALATEMKLKGASIHFITRAHTGHLADMLSCDGFAVTLLPQPPAVENKTADYSTWLGVTQQADADQTIAALDNQQSDWLIVDHYGLDSRWETQLRSYTCKLMVIDDLANRQHDCDVLLDQNYSHIGKERYQAWVPTHCQLLLGPRYALLRPEYARYRKIMLPRTGSIKRVLVFMGGTDNTNITGKVLSALNAGQLVHLEVDVVIGPLFIHKESVTAQAKSRQNTNIYGQSPHLADLMIKADLAIGAGGATMWERICLNLPSMVLSVAENQIPACKSLAALGLIHYLGVAHDLDVSYISAALIEAIADTEQMHSMILNSKTLVDGRGTSRVAEFLVPSPAANLKLRLANTDDALTYFSWVNDTEVRSSAINSAPIDWPTHLKWFNCRLIDENSHLYVLETGDLPIGQVRFERYSEVVTIDYSLDVLVRGRGWAKQLLKLGILAMNTSCPTQLKATVKPENFASAATFMRLGFIEQAIDNGIGNRNFLLPSSQIKQFESTNDFLK